MINIIKIITKIIYIALALLFASRIVLKVSAMTPGPFINIKKTLISFIYNTTDTVTIPFNNFLISLQTYYPGAIKSFFPILHIEKNGGILESSAIISIILIITAGLILEHILKILSDYEKALLNINITPKEANSHLKNDKLKKLKTEATSKNSTTKEQDLKNVYNLIIRRLDREKTELVNKNISLEKEIITDTLTGLKTRKYLNERLKHEFSAAKIRKKELSIVMLDIDHFKNVNDKYGHQIGDMVLRDVSKIIIASCMLNTFAARYGGEEITIICPKQGTKEAIILAESIRKEIEEKLQYDGKKCNAITISAGIATYNGNDDIKSPEDLIVRADEALYEAKNNGRNRVSAYNN